MHLINLKTVQEVGFSQLEFAGMNAESLQILRDGDRVGIFYRGVCYAIFSEDDKFSRNYFLVQLHIGGRVKLKELAALFGLGYQHCSNTVVRFREEGIEGVRDSTSNMIGNRRIITDKIGKFIVECRGQEKTYSEISQAIRFRFKKKIKAESICSWVCREAKASRASGAEVLDPDAQVEIRIRSMNPHFSKASADPEKKLCDV